MRFKRFGLVKYILLVLYNLKKQHFITVFFALIDLIFPAGFKLKDFLRDNETLSVFLERNASLPEHAVREIVEANVNLEKVMN